jgi:hypothetical protein
MSGSLLAMRGARYAIVKPSPDGCLSYANIVSKTCLLLSFVALAACGGPRESAAAASAARSAPIPKKVEPHPAPPPLGPLPGSTFKPIPEIQALSDAGRMGPGDCGDLERMQGLPIMGQHGFDPYYDRIMVHIAAYKQCLLEKTGSTEPTHITPSYPGVRIRNKGDLAHILLLDGRAIAWGDCVPEHVIEQEKHGKIAFDIWIEEPSSRKQWHQCLLRKHGR